MPSAELIVWGILPALAAVVASALSVRSATRNFGAVQFGLSVGVVGLCLFSLVVLKRIFVDGAWPTALPHLAIAAACCMAGLQRWMDVSATAPDIPSAQ